MGQIKLSELAGQSVPALFLEKVLFQKEILPQTYLFYGPEYSGKEFLAIQFFKALNCEQEPGGFCGHCHSCVKIESLSSSDLYFLFSYADVRKLRLFCDFFLKNPIPGIEKMLKREIYKMLVFLAPNKAAKKNLDSEKLYEIYEKPLSPALIKSLHDFIDFAESLSKNIPVESIRNTLEKIYLSSYELKYKLILIKDAADLSQESANTLLKTIEEPPANTIIILLTNKIGRILPTIRSRTMKVRFKPYSEEDMKKISTAMNYFPYAQLTGNTPPVSFLTENLDEINLEETLVLIDFLKQDSFFLSPLQREKLNYLNDLKIGLRFYNLSLSSVKNALRVLLAKKK